MHIGGRSKEGSGGAGVCIAEHVQLLSAVSCAVLMFRQLGFLSGQSIDGAKPDCQLCM